MKLIVKILFSQGHEDKIQPENCSTEQNQEVISAKAIRQYISEQLEATGDFSWSDVDAEILWSAAIHGDGILTIGFSNNPYRVDKGRAADEIRNDIVSITKTIESDGLKNSLRDEDVVVYEPDFLNYIDLKVTKLETVVGLLSLEGIRYIEPNGFSYLADDMVEKSSSGCDKDPVSVSSADYTTLTPGCQVSWVFYKHNIPLAWTISTGAGIGVGLIDTGISDDQSLL